jgi:hypothetical protein
MGEMRDTYNILVGKPETKGPLGRPKHGLEDSIRIDLWEMGYKNLDLVHLAKGRDQKRALVNTEMNLRIP